MKTTKQKKCLNPKCERMEAVRGLCGSCYTTAAKLVKAKEITWEELEKNGRCLPRKKHFSGETPTNWLLSK